MAEAVTYAERRNAEEAEQLIDHIVISEVLLRDPRGLSV